MKTMYICDNILLNSYENQKCFGQKLRKSKHTVYVS